MKSIKPAFSPIGIKQSSKGSALIIILSGIVLISVLVLLFMSKTTTNRMISFSSASQYRAEVIAKTGIDTVLGDILTEIIAGSTISTKSGTPIYFPRAASTAIPFDASPQGFSNVLKISAGGKPAWEGTNYNNTIISPIRARSGNSTMIPAKGGRAVLKDRWNAPYLLGDTLPTGFVPPDWIIVTRSGVINSSSSLPTLARLSDPTLSNGEYAIGRYSYIIYNEGGLIDINLAGFPNNISNDFKSKRGLLAQLDLETIPGIHDSQAIVEWRNRNTSKTADSYSNYVLNNTNGFTKTAHGDQIFVNRQDLIRYAKKHPQVLDLSALQYLATFTRELNAPSYSPPPLSGPNALRRPVNSQFSASGKEDLFNPSLIDCRVSKEFTRVDGTEAKIGEPLLKTRFPLSRLGLLTHATVADEDSAIYRYFGLSRSSRSEPWIYRGNTNKILTLNEVAAEGREPDFFELLQAGIWIGSLGQSIGDKQVEHKFFDRNTFHQIIQIGANLIDQYDNDSWPTRIAFNASSGSQNTIFSGRENLPYLSQIAEPQYRMPGSGTDGRSASISMWYRPRLWNPFSQATTIPSASEGPTKFRFISQGKASASIYKSNWLTGGGYDLIASSPPNIFSQSQGITFSNSPNFSHPMWLDSAPDVHAEGRDKLDDGTTQMFGIWVGDANSPDRANSQRSIINPDPTVKVQHLLQYKDGSQWVTYDAIRDQIVGSSTAATRLSDLGVASASLTSRPDPSCDRFGTFGSDAGNQDGTFRPNTAPGNLVWVMNTNSSDSFGWNFGIDYASTPAIALGLLSENKSDATSFYTDPDQTVRRADGAYADGNLSHGGYPLALNQYSSRPRILNRPFRSVAEMGYASRAMPWKTIDFFTSESADSALLDLFCINEPDKSAIRAGVIDLNSRQMTSFKTALLGSSKNEDDGTLVSELEALSNSKSLINLTNEEPLLNRSDLVTRWLGNITSIPADSADTIIKRRRESAIRSLSEIGSTRAWNLLIDIIAQSGKYTQSSQDENQFSVEGEKRYWMHISIDRYTGKVLEQSIEPVFE